MRASINGVEDARTNRTLPIESILNVAIGAHRVYPLSLGYVEEFPGIIDDLELIEGVLTLSY